MPSPRSPVDSSNFLSFPREILEHIFSFLDVADLGRLARVCKCISSAAAAEHCWRAVFERRFSAISTRELLLDTSIAPTRNTNRYREALRSRNGALLIVDANGSGQGIFSSLSEALLCASPGDLLVVRPGTYVQDLVVELDVEIIGDGRRDAIQVRPRYSPDAHSRGLLILDAPTRVRVANLTLVPFHSAPVELHGTVTLEECVVRGSVRVGAHSVVVLRRNRIHDSVTAGVHLGARDVAATLERNDIFDHQYGLVAKPLDLPGLPATGGIVATLTRNKIHTNMAHGVLVAGESTQVTLTRNDIYDNMEIGVKVDSGATATLRSNAIHHNRGKGLVKKGRTTLEANRVYENADGDGVDLLHYLSSFIDLEQWQSWRVVALAIFIVSWTIQLTWNHFLRPLVGPYIGYL